MSLKLTEQEVEALMTAVEGVLEPWLDDRILRIDVGTGQTTPMRMRGMVQDAPEPVKELEMVYMGIVSVGASAGGCLRDEQLG